VQPETDHLTTQHITGLNLHIQSFVL